MVSTAVSTSSTAARTERRNAKDVRFTPQSCRTGWSASDDIADIMHTCEIGAMQVSVLQGSVLIGTGVLDHLDPPMGVAFGQFTPSPQYERDQHANTVEGDYVGDAGKSLAVFADEHRRIDAAAIAIEDWTQSFGETHLTIFFADGNDFRSFFAQHADYKSYYGQSD